jgi:hypothetical protein
MAPALADTTAECPTTVKDSRHILDNRGTKQLIEARDALSKYRMFVGDCDLTLEQTNSGTCDPAAKRRKNGAYGESIEPNLALTHAVIHSTVRETLPATTVSPVPAVHATVVFRSRRRYQS